MLNCQRFHKSNPIHIASIVICPLFICIGCTTHYSKESFKISTISVESVADSPEPGSPLIDAICIHTIDGRLFCAASIVSFETTENDVFPWSLDDPKQVLGQPNSNCFEQTTDKSFDLTWAGYVEVGFEEDVYIHEVDTIEIHTPPSCSGGTFSVHLINSDGDGYELCHSTKPGDLTCKTQ